MTPVLITAVCPACETRYNLPPSRRGQQIRCPNPQCRSVFTVPAEDPPQQPPAPGNGHKTGSVGDLVPLVEAQAVEPPARSWKEPPPVRRPAPEEPPRELPPGAWAPPPVRRGPADPPAEATPEPAVEERLEEVAEAPVEEPVEHRPPTKRLGLIVGLIVGLLMVFIGGGGVAVWFLMGRSESSMSGEAEQAYKQGKFDQAKDMFGQLQKTFPSSDKRDDYHFMEALSDFRGQARAPDADVNAVLARLSTFLDENRKAAPLKDRAPDLAESLGWLTNAFAMRNAAPQDEGPLAVAKRIEEAMARVNTINSEAPSAELRTHIDAALGGVRFAVEHMRMVRGAVARIEKAAKAPTPSQAVRNVNKQIKKEKIDLPEIDQNADVQQIRARVYDEHIGSVQFNSGRKRPWQGRTTGRSRRASSSIRCSAGRRTGLRRTTRSCWRCPAASSTPWTAPTARSNGRSASASTPRRCRSACRSRRASPSASWCRRPTTRPWTPSTRDGDRLWRYRLGGRVHRSAAGRRQPRLPGVLRRQRPRDRAGPGQGAGASTPSASRSRSAASATRTRPALLRRRRLLRLRNRSGSAQMRAPALHRPSRRVAARRAADRRRPPTTTGPTPTG